MIRDWTSCSDSSARQRHPCASTALVGLLAGRPAGGPFAGANRCSSRPNSTMLRDRLARMHRWTKSADTAVEPSRFGRVSRAARKSSRTRSSARGRKSGSRQQVLGTAFEEEVLDLTFDDVRGLIVDDPDGEFTDCAVPENPGEGLGVRGRREQASQPVVLVSRRWRRSALCACRSSSAPGSRGIGMVARLKLARLARHKAPPHRATPATMNPLAVHGNRCRGAVGGRE